MGDGGDQRIGVHVMEPLGCCVGAMKMALMWELEMILDYGMNIGEEFRCIVGDGEGHDVGDIDGPGVYTQVREAVLLLCTQAHQIDKLTSIYSARVLTYAKNFTPGSLQYLQDLAFIKGVMNKNDYAKNRAELAECAKIQEAIGLSGCQSEYDYRNGSNHVDHACNLFYVFKTVELMIKEDPDGHLLKMENLRHHRQEHFECVPLFQSGQVPPPNIDIPSPLQTSPNVLTPPAYDRVVPIIEELD